MSPTRATTGIAAAAAVAAVLCGATACSEDDPVTDSATDSAATPSASTEESEATPSSMVDFGEEPGVRRRYKRGALKAVGDGLITMVPASLPDDWSAEGGGYRVSGPQWWRMEFTTPSGPVVLDQLAGSLDDALEPHQDSLTGADDVDLSDWGIGTWSQWSNGDLSLLARELKGSVVVIQASDTDSASDLAKSLLPAEDARSVEG